jgi:intracellular sulfur oxidation DsrE/DsrF family protein
MNFRFVRSQNSHEVVSRSSVARSRSINLSFSLSLTARRVIVLAGFVAAGVAELARLQGMGFAYIHL